MVAEITYLCIVLIVVLVVCCLYCTNHEDGE